VAVIDSIKNSFIQVGNDFKEISGKIGNLSSLTTTAKNSLVSAINELKQKLKAKGGVFRLLIFLPLVELISPTP
jgi:hypothetical protein